MIQHKQIAEWLGVAGLIGMLGVSQSHAALVSQYKLEGNGTDEFGVQNGTLSGGPSTVTGKIGNALSFNGSSSVNITDVAAHRPTNITISAWVNTTDTGAFRGVFDKVNNSQGIAIFVNAGSVTLTSGTNGPVTGAKNVIGGNVADGNWHLLTGTFQTTNSVNSSGILRLYVDGLLAGSTNAFYQGTVTTAAIAGDNASSFLLNGTIDDVGLWSDALSDAKARALYSLADTGALNYDLGQAQQLFNVYDAAGGTTLVAGRTWGYTMISGTPGVVQQIGPDFALPLGGGFGLFTVPEPTTMALLAIGGLLLARRR